MPENPSAAGPVVRRPRRVVVRDDSMRPTLKPGDRLKVDPSAYLTRAPAPGEIVVLVDPDEPTRWLVKRVSSVDEASRTVDVRGDATEVARDSRRFGPVRFEAVLGRVTQCYLPGARRREF